MAEDWEDSYCKLEFCYMSEERLYFVMEFISGAMLSKSLSVTKNRRLPEEHVRSIITQLVTTVSQLHASCIMDCDIKLSNLMLDSQGYLKLIYFD